MVYLPDDILLARLLKRQIMLRLSHQKKRKKKKRNYQCVPSTML